MKKLLFLSGICLVTQCNIPLHAASAAQQAYERKIAAAQALLDLAELDLLIAEDRNFFISMMQTENVTREIGTDSALTREERKALSTIAEALLDMHQDKTIQLSTADNDTIRTYINPPKAPEPTSTKPASGPKEGSHEWHLANLREELRTRLHSLGAAARDVTVEMYEKLLKEKDAALKAIQKKINLTSAKDKKKIEAQNASEKSALNAFVQELRTKLIDLKTKVGQEITQQREAEKAARPMAGAASLERKITTPLERLSAIQEELQTLHEYTYNLQKQLLNALNSTNQEAYINALKQYVNLTKTRDDLIAKHPDLQAMDKQEIKNFINAEYKKLSNFYLEIQRGNHINQRQELNNFATNIPFELLMYPKTGKKQKLNLMRTALQLNPGTNTINIPASIDALNEIDIQTLDMNFLRDLLIMFLQTDTAKSHITENTLDIFFNTIKFQLFPEERIQEFNNLKKRFPSNRTKDDLRKDDAETQALYDDRIINNNVYRSLLRISNKCLSQKTLEATNANPAEARALRRKITDLILAANTYMLGFDASTRSANIALLTTLRDAIAYNPDGSIANKDTILSMLTSAEPVIPAMAIMYNLLRAYIILLPVHTSNKEDLNLLFARARMNMYELFTSMEPDSLEATAERIIIFLEDAYANVPSLHTLLEGFFCHPAIGSNIDVFKSKLQDVLFVTSASYIRDIIKSIKILLYFSHIWANQEDQDDHIKNQQIALINQLCTQIQKRKNIELRTPFAAGTSSSSSSSTNKSE